MTRSKKVFLIIAAIFLVIVAIIIYDFSRRTTLPGRPRPAAQR
jgi:hypothetical protein